MPKSLLFIVGSDPRESSRPAEAIRIASGICASKRIDVRVCLKGAAVLMLGDDADELLDEDHFERCLPILCESGRPILILRESAHTGSIGKTALPYQEVNADELGEVAAESDYTANF